MFSQDRVFVQLRATGEHVTWDDVVTLCSRFPGVVTAVSYGEPSLKVGPKLLTRHRLADDSLVLLDVPEGERALLLARDPQVFFMEDHYVPYDIVLARLPALTPDLALPRLDRRWRAIAGKRRVAAYDAGGKN